PGRGAAGRSGREEILSAAAHAIARHGYHGMSMRELARATGKALASSYSHFRSKDEILFALQSSAFEELDQSAERALAAVAGAPADAATRLYAFIENHIAFCAREPDVMHVLVQEAAALPRPQRAQVRALKERYFARARELVGAVARLDDDELERATYSLFGMLNWTFGWYEPRKHGPAAVLARTIHRLTLGGLPGLSPTRRDRSGGSAKHGGSA
ncbi:MAG: TetR/AcrR family transcriptional regulator, partial [Myxococcales bacterium]|nr:TetR/AcrR family transcriptional regulator [Myxococcales bacterium]